MGNSKTAKSVGIVQRVANTLKTPKVFEIIKYQEKNEATIKAQIYPYLVAEVAKIYADINGHKPETCERKASENLLWEGNVKTVVNNITLFNTWHRPDMILEYSKDLHIAIEVKRGDDGKSIRDGVGQALFYAQHYNFVILLHVDIGKKKDMLASLQNERERALVAELWNYHNILLEIV